MAKSQLTKPVPRVPARDPGRTSSPCPAIPMHAVLMVPRTRTHVAWHVHMMRAAMSSAPYFISVQVRRRVRAFCGEGVIRAGG